jgi:hypothetical protein
MKVICITSNDYSDLMPDFAINMCIHWPNQPVTVLYYDRCPVLPDNFTRLSLGSQPCDKDWTSGLIDYFKYLTDEYFVLMLDDYFVDRDVDLSLMKQVVNFVEFSRCDKFDLTTDRANFPHVYTQWPFIVESHPASRYRSSLQAAIWKTSYFRKFLIPKRTPWEFETIGEQEAKYDGAVIMGTSVGVVHYRNEMLKGARR